MQRLLSPSSLVTKYVFAFLLSLQTLFLGASETKNPSTANIQADESQVEGVLTPMGAQLGGNSDNSIPLWSGSMRGAPEGISYAGSSDVHPNPYAADKVIINITAENYQQYADKLSDGQKALFKHYPETFSMPIYPSHRDGRYSTTIEERSQWNAEHTKLVGTSDGILHYSGGVPFPKPKTGAEVIWNAKLNHPNYISDTIYDEIAVYADGDKIRHRKHMLFETSFAKEGLPPLADIDKYESGKGFVLIKQLEPSREKNKMVLIHELFDKEGYSRNAWIYMPGLKRVRRVPVAGFDTPDGPGGLKTADDNLGFNGSMQRYKWSLIGKSEIYIPYHNYQFNTQGTDFDSLLLPLHANPDFMRYELHRVWVVEGFVADGNRHIYAKRRFYIDEDSWMIVLTDNYDGRGDLWRVGMQNSSYNFQLQGYTPGVQFNHDLLAKAYVASGLVNDTRPPRFNAKPKGKRYFTPKKLAALGR